MKLKSFFFPILFVIFFYDLKLDLFRHSFGLLFFPFLIFIIYILITLLFIIFLIILILIRKLAFSIQICLLLLYTAVHFLCNTISLTNTCVCIWYISFLVTNRVKIVWFTFTRILHLKFIFIRLLFVWSFLRNIFL